MRFRPRRGVLSALVGALGLLALGGAARADRIAHPVAVFSGLDKITGRIISFEVAIDETVQFGTLQLTPRACYTRPATETPQTIAFLEVDEVDAKNQYKRIFSGWMFAASPGLHGVEHPIYDVWLTDCRGGKETTPSPDAPGAQTPPTPQSAAPQPAPEPKKTKPRRVQPQTPAPIDPFAADPALRDQRGGEGPVEVGPPPGFEAPGAPPPQQQPRRQRRQAPAADPFDAPLPPGDIPQSAPRGGFPDDRF
ncbi:DUF2155 domain-containing protein [Methylocella sp.]|uniref:DUF2155 domain-containing protein n=1 Tax=Methylocella sp. TaxID=1978226 RepID=UPI0037852699